MMTEKLFVDVILPLALPRMLTYAVPGEFAGEIAVGKRVVVQLGRQRIYSALVRKIHHDPPSGYDVKNIFSVLDEFPVVNEHQFRLWDWIAEYYLSTLGDVMNAALPSVLKLQSETRILLNPAYEHDHEK